MKSLVDAKKETRQFDGALELIAKANKLYSCRGKKVVEIDLKKDSPDEETLQKLMLGPTGNLRAPTHKIGKTIVVGFNEDTYQHVFG